jgi:PKD repeat protein
VAKFTRSCAEVTCDLDATSSFDPDGEIVSRRWVPGDGAVLFGKKVSHTYAAPGTYTIKLVVKDDRGATAVKKKSVTVP